MAAIKTQINNKTDTTPESLNNNFSLLQPTNTSTPITTNENNALLIKYLMKHGSSEIRERIMKNSDLDELVSITTKHEDIDDATRKLIRVSRALRFI